MDKNTERKYTLDELQLAFDVGWEQSGEGFNAEWVRSWEEASKILNEAFDNFVKSLD